jgi:hypothetical protein
MKNTKPYYSLFVYCPESQEWFDEFGSYFLQEVKTEIEWSHFDKPKRFVKIGCLIMCKNKIEIDVRRGYSYKTVLYSCGSTGVDGDLILCPNCSPNYAAIRARSDEYEDRYYVDY